MFMFEKGNQHTDMQMRQCYDISVNGNEEMLAGYADLNAGYPDADPGAT